MLLYFTKAKYKQKLNPNKSLYLLGFLLLVTENLNSIRFQSSTRNFSAADKRKFYSMPNVFVNKIYEIDANIVSTISYKIGKLIITASTST